MRLLLPRVLLAFGLTALATGAAMAQHCPTTTPVQGAPLPTALPVFPADNWWNTDISSAPVDPSSAGFISFIGGTRRLHPDFGGEESPGSTGIYGFPYVIVDGAQPRQAVTFDYDDESDGHGVPFYPIPAQAITQPHWVEGGAPGNVDQRSENDRHLLIIDCSAHALYELYSVHYDVAQQRWHAGSGAFFDMGRNDRRPEGWTSADASGMAIFPGLVRYDEAANPAIPEISHALRVTLRASNGYVYPASHAAGSTAGALPMGARLRLKALVDGVDPVTRTNDPVARKIFRAMQKYGLIMADNGSDMYVSGTFDVRWDNGVLNPAFSSLRAGDFEVIQLGWKPAPPVARLDAVGATPNPVVGGQSSVGTVRLSAVAPAGGASIGLASASNAFSVPASVSVPQGASSASFPISTATSTLMATGSLTASYAGVSRTTSFTVNPTPPGVSIADRLVAEGDTGTRVVTFTVTLSRPATSAVEYTVATADGSAAAGSDYVAYGATRTIMAGQASDSFNVVINGDTTREANERFLVNLGAPAGTPILDGQAIATIINDEGRIAMPQTGSSVARKPSATQAAPVARPALPACNLHQPAGMPRCFMQVAARWRAVFNRWRDLLETPDP